MEMQEGTCMQQHLKNIKELTDKLAAIGAPIGEEDQVVTLLGSLLKSYTTPVTALEAHVDNISLDFVHQALIHEGQKHSGDRSKQIRICTFWKIVTRKTRTAHV